VAQQFIYQMQGLKKVTDDGKEVLKGIWLSFYPGAKIGVIGHNGAGKSTLLRIMAGVDKEFQGDTWIDPKAKVGYLEQEPELDPSLDVRGNIELGVKGVRDLLTRFDEIGMKFAEEMTDDQMQALIDEQARLQDQIDASDAWNLDRTIEIAMDALRVPPGEADVTKLSGGEKRRVALCKLLLSKPDLLLLDEPTNHLDAESVAWLERTLREYHGTVILVTHDRYFLDNVTSWILELENGEGLPFEGNYSSWLDQKQKILEQKEKSNSKRAKVLAQELEWVRMNQKARQAKNKARIQRYEELVAQANSDAPERIKSDIVIPAGPRLGDVVVEVEHLSKGYGDRLLIDDLSFRLPPGGIVGVVGANGAGKTTLFRMLLGQEQPDSGTIKVGETVKIANAEQVREGLDPEKSVWEVISGGQETIQIGRQTLNTRAYVSAFGFKGKKQQQKVGTLSGGERNRLYLAKVLQAGANLLLLDEPSNDLDVETLRELEEALATFPGCAVVISHDRWFLDRLATHILAFEGNSHVEWFEGNYQEYERDRRKRLGEDADQPKRLKYKPIVRK
jgi:ATP-binding cassette ChvD family protein